MNKRGPFFVGQMSAVVIAAFGSAIPPAIANGPVPEQAALVIHGCQPETHAALMEEFPPSNGMTIELVACLPFRFDSFGKGEPFVSPTGSMVAQWHDGSPAPLEIAGISTSAYAQLSNPVSIFRTFGIRMSMVGKDRPALAWSDDGTSLLTVRQDALGSGLAVGGLMPIRVSPEGKPTPLPVLRHSAGPLDALQWIGGTGLALAQFGTRGAYYRPAHPDPAPTYAIVDAGRGKIRATLPASAIAELSGQTERDAVRFAGAVATATTLPNGKVRAVFQFRSARAEPTFRVVWTEASKPQSWWDSEDIGSESAVLLTPDGSKMIVNRRLQPEGVRVFDCWKDGQRIGECGPPPTPVAGPIVELVDVATRHRIWRVSASASVFWNQMANPAISPNAELALVEMPPENDRRIVGLISMRDGQVLDRFAATSTGSMPFAFGFTADGTHAWVMCGNAFVRYRIAATATE